MKHTILLLIVLVLVVGCAAKCPPVAMCPPADIVFTTPHGLLGMDKGALSEENRGSTWMTLEEFKRLRELQRGM